MTPHTLVAFQFSCSCRLKSGAKADHKSHFISSCSGSILKLQLFELHRRQEEFRQQQQEGRQGLEAEQAESARRALERRQRAGAPQPNRSLPSRRPSKKFDTQRPIGRCSLFAEVSLFVSAAELIILFRNLVPETDQAGTRAEKRGKLD